jgi:hypothetical protein
MVKAYFVGYIKREIDERRFEVSLWPTMDFPFESDLSDELFNINRKVRPLKGNRILLEYNSDLNEFVIVAVR